MTCGGRLYAQELAGLRAASDNPGPGASTAPPESAVAAVEEHSAPEQNVPGPTTAPLEPTAPACTGPNETITASGCDTADDPIHHEPNTSDLDPCAPDEPTTIAPEAIHDEEDDDEPFPAAAETSSQQHTPVGQMAASMMASAAQTLEGTVATFEMLGGAVPEDVMRAMALVVAWAQKTAPVGPVGVER